jgi:hypothetical protein
MTVERRQRILELLAAADAPEHGFIRVCELLAQRQGAEAATTGICVVGTSWDLRTQAVLPSSWRNTSNSPRSMGVVDALESSSVLVCICSTPAAMSGVICIGHRSSALKQISTSENQPEGVRPV